MGWMISESIRCVFSTTLIPVILWSGGEANQEISVNNNPKTC